MKLLDKLKFWRKRTQVTGMSIPVLIPKGTHKVTVSFTSNKEMDTMIVKDNGEVLGYRQVTKKLPKSKSSKEKMQ